LFDHEPGRRCGSRTSDESQAAEGSGVARAACRPGQAAEYLDNGVVRRPIEQRAQNGCSVSLKYYRAAAGEPCHREGCARCDDVHRAFENVPADPGESDCVNGFRMIQSQARPAFGKRKRFTHPTRLLSFDPGAAFCRDHEEVEATTKARSSPRLRRLSALNDKRVAPQTLVRRGEAEMMRANAILKPSCAGWYHARELHHPKIYRVNDTSLSEGAIYQ